MNPRHLTLRPQLRQSPRSAPPSLFFYLWPQCVAIGCARYPSGPVSNTFCSSKFPHGVCLGVSSDHSKNRKGQSSHNTGSSQGNVSGGLTTSSTDQASASGIPSWQHHYQQAETDRTSTYVNINLIQIHSQRNIDKTAGHISGHCGPTKLTHKTNHHNEGRKKYF